jgi:acyl-CoA synthetase (NDP forming)
VAREIVHKSDVQGVVFVHKRHESVQREIERLVTLHGDSAQVEGVLVVEFIEGGTQLGRELFVGVRATREFGPVIAAGLGGVDTEFLACRLLPCVAVARALALETTAEEFLDQFKRTAAYELLSGHVRGHPRSVSDGDLLRCFQAFIALARKFCVRRGVEGPDVAELEVNPFVLRHQQLVSVDGRGRLASAPQPDPARPLDKVRHLLEPKTLAVLGASANAMNFGRIILNNVKNCGFAARHLYCVKDGLDQLDGVRCVPSVAKLPETVDLLVVAAGAPQLPQIVADVIASNKVHSAILIPGGVGETEGSEEIQVRVREAIQLGRQRPDGGPVFLGPNCMGVQSRPGRYDTFFIPADKLDNRWSAPAKRVAFLSQSGAFIVSRLSNIEMLDPAIAVSIGNQLDLTIADLTHAVARRADIDVIAVYVEGFTNFDGLDFVRAVRAARNAGKTVIFYKAGRTPSGRSAAAGHTASIAGDYDVCRAATCAAGALVADNFKEFEQLTEVAVALHGKPVKGRRLGAISNAGFETVGVADGAQGQGYEITIPTLSDKTKARLTDVLAGHKLAGLVNARNPVDLTPMSSDQVYEDALRTMLVSDDVDALIVGLVPLTPALLTTPDEIAQPGSLAHRLPRLFAEAAKPFVLVIDAGPRYDPLVRAIRAGGVPVFRSGDQAVRALARYLCYRTE